MFRPVRAAWQRVTWSWPAAAVGVPLALLVWTSMAARGAGAAPGVPGAMPLDQVKLLIVEAHDEWAGDPRRIPAPPRLASRTMASVASRNRNPLNIKYGALTRKYVEQGLASISRILPRDGGRFLKFHSATGGFRAAVDLLTSPLYASLDLDGALKRWSHNGYGAEIVGKTIDASASAATLEQERLTHLLRSMAAAEGYRSSRLSDEIATALANRR